MIRSIAVAVVWGTNQVLAAKVSAAQITKW